jgi:hypothetical protein
MSGVIGTGRRNRRAPFKYFFPDQLVKKRRACDLTKLRVRDVCLGQRVALQATVMQQKTRRCVQFEITEPTRDSAEEWIKVARLTPPDFCF